jgi:tetratricopeptide (TPR) repeat protein
LGFDLKVAEKEIHELDDKFDFCVEVEYNEEDCSSIKTRIETDRSSVVVMSPYPLAIGKSIPQSTEKAVFGSLYQKEMVLEFTNWWVQGNISNENYVKSLQILSGIESGDGIETVGIISKPSMVVLFEPPTSEKPQQTNEDFSEITQSLLRMSPFNEDNKNKLSPEDEQVFILWLKTKSNSWTYNEITDEEFIKDLEYLLNSPKTDLYLNYFQSLSVRELINKGIEFKEAGELKNAISYFDHAIIRSIDAGSQDFDALILKGSTLTALQQYKEALIYFDNALNEEPENSVALKKKAFVLAQLGHLDEAKNYFRLAHQIETSLR